MRLLSLLLLLLLPSLMESRESPLDCFVVSTEHTLLGTAFAAPKVPNLQACLRQCLRRRKCRSVLYYRSKNVCVLNAQRKEERPSGFVSTEGLAESSDYYERICYDRTRAVARAAVTAKECFTVESGKVLIGIVDQQIKNVKTLEKCMRACQDSKRKSDRVCKSAMYYEKEQECIIASQNKMDSPDLYIEDEMAVYVENNCWSEGVETTTAVAERESTVETTTTSDAATTEMQIETTQEVEVQDVAVTSTELPPPTTTATVATTTTVSSSTTGKPRLPDHLVLPELISPLNAAPPLEESGYVIAPEYEVTKKMGAVRKSEIVSQHVVDTYGVEPKRDAKKPVKGKKAAMAVLSPPLTTDLPPVGGEHTRRLRHPAVKDCFSEIAPRDVSAMNGKVVKAYSVEQCVDICRLCSRCLRRKTCVTVAYNEQAFSCGLSSESVDPLDELNANETKSVVFFARGHC